MFIRYSYVHLYCILHDYNGLMLINVLLDLRQNLIYDNNDILLFHTKIILKKLDLVIMCKRYLFSVRT